VSLLPAGAVVAPASNSSNGIVPFSVLDYAIGMPACGVRQANAASDVRNLAANPRYMPAQTT
jgi:hypothetical protein